MGSKKRLLFLSVLATPLFAIVNPASFFLAYINCFEDTGEPYLYQPSFIKYFAIAFPVYCVITLLKFPFFKLKRRFAKKVGSGFALFYLFHSASQLPYLILFSVFFNYWKPINLNDLSFGFFLWYFAVSIFTWIISFSVFNFLTYLYPLEEEA